MTTSQWRVTSAVRDALIALIVPPLPLAMLLAASHAMHKRLANPKRKRKQAVNYPIRP